MKITKEDLKRLENLITKYVHDNDIMPRSEYPGMTTTRYCWDIFHGTLDHLQYNNVPDYLFIRRLCDYMNDNHMHTALKHILI